MQLGSSVFRGYVNAPQSLWGPFRKEKEVNLPLHESPAENWAPSYSSAVWKLLHSSSGTEELLRSTFNIFLQKTASQQNGWEQQRIILQTSPIQRAHLPKLRKRRWYQGSSGTVICICERRRRKMSKPNYSGTFHMVEQDNMDEYLAALGGNLLLYKSI